MSQIAKIFREIHQEAKKEYKRFDVVERIVEAIDLYNSLNRKQALDIIETRSTDPVIVKAASIKKVNEWLESMQYYEDHRLILPEESESIQEEIKAVTVTVTAAQVTEAETEFTPMDYEEVDNDNDDEEEYYPSQVEKDLHPEKVELPKVKDYTTGKAEFRLKLRDNRVLFNVVTQVRKLVEEATFEVNQEGLSFRGMDPSHVALIDVNIPNQCFEAFEIEADNNAKFGIRVDELLTLFKKFDKKDREVTLSMGEDSMLAIKSGTFNAKVRLIESSASSVPLPKLNFNAKLEIDVPTVRQISSFIDGLEYLAIESETNKVILSSKGDVGEFETKLDRNTNYNMVFEIKEDSKAVYSIDYLKNFITPFLRDFKAVQTDNLTFEYSTKMPARLSYKILEYGRLDFYVAPRVQD